MWSPIPSDLSVQKVTGPELLWVVQTTIRAMQEAILYMFTANWNMRQNKRDCESSGRILTTWRQEAKTPIIVDSRLQFRAGSDCFHLCLDLQRKSGNRHQSQVSRLLVLLVRCSRCTSTSAAVAAASELPDRALSRHLPSLHPLQHLQHLRVFERCCGCCRPQPTPHPARWLEKNLPKLRGAVPGKAAPSRGGSRPLPLQMSAENYKIWKQETSQMKQLMAKL